MTITAAPAHGDLEEAAPSVAGITTLLQALADPVRLELLRSLASSDQPICCGSFQVPVTKSTLSHHLRVLREAGVIEQRCDGTRRLTSLRRHDLDARYPGLIQSLLQAPAESGTSL
jgi:DNA-binding transcriptional ArsR family regulator